MRGAFKEAAGAGPRDGRGVVGGASGWAGRPRSGPRARPPDPAEHRSESGYDLAQVSLGCPLTRHRDPRKCAWGAQARCEPGRLAVLAKSPLGLTS